ncbi:MAG: hypothetical protein H7122_06755 [Chitinophagaceae bacterium]|nr:hypothetical protein [Chitinophagaceae bacterium]
MKSKTSFWQRIGLHDWFLKKDIEPAGNRKNSLTPNDVFHYILEKFDESIQQLSFSNRVVFYHEYIICFNPDDYKDFMENKKGIFGLIVQESVTKFYELLQGYRSKGKMVQPSSSKWVFRFASNPDYTRGDKSFIGKLLPGTIQQKEENLRVTFIPRQTGIAQTFDINPDILQGFTFYSDSYYEISYREDLVHQDKDISQKPSSNGKARLETIIPEKEYAGRKLEYFMKEEDIIISGKEETRENTGIFRIPSEWVNTPHLRIRFNKNDDKFYLASFGEKTLVNEKEVQRSNVNSPEWSELPINSRMVLNGIVGINIFKT